jgi:hypothetical protein
MRLRSHTGVDNRKSVLTRWQLALEFISVRGHKEYEILNFLCASAPLR